MRDDGEQVREIKRSLTDVRTVCERLGFLGGKGSFVRQSNGLIIRCPWHDEKTPSCSVQLRGGVIMAKCHGCQTGGDVLSLVAAAHHLSLKRDFRQVLIAAAELGGLHGLVQELETGQVNPERRSAPAPRVEPEPERDYPPQREVDALWHSCTPVAEDLDVAAWLISRGSDPELVDAGELARALPEDVVTPWWASWQRKPWASLGHRLVVPMRDHLGVIRTVRAGRIVDGETPKRLPPGGHRASGVVMADEMATALLTGSRIPERLVIVEGEPDYLAMATRRHPVPTAVLGIVGGSWTVDFAFRFPEGCAVEVVIWTDADKAGDAYAEAIKPWLIQRGCFVRRDFRRAA